MKKYKFVLLLALVAAGIQSACTPPKADKQKILSVTIDPQKYFLEKIVGNKYEVNCVVPAGSNPESFDIAPSQMMMLSKSVAYFKVGYLGIENTLIEKVKENNPNVLFIDCSEGIEAGQGHHHHDHDHADCNHGTGHDGGDPHIWSSPATVQVMADNMYKTVIELDSINKDFYKTNFAELQAELSATDSIIKSYIASAPSKSFVIYHPALSYFAEEYGLKQLTIEQDGKAPSPIQLKQLIDDARKEDVKVVFIQKEYDTKNAEAVAKAIGAKTLTIDLLSYYWKEELVKIAKSISQQTEK